MAFVVTRLCRDCKDYSCVSMCPTECIVEHRPQSGASDLPNQVFIDPDDCIHCNLCAPECPWDAIFPEDDVPEEFKVDVPLNALVKDRRGEFEVPEAEPGPPPTVEQVEVNWAKWGASP